MSINIEPGNNIEHHELIAEIRPAFAAALEKASGKPLETVPLRNWVLGVKQDIESVIQGAEGVDEKKLQLHLAKNPAAKLLEFFETLVAQTQPSDILAVENTAEASENLREVDAIKPKWIEKWVKEWLQ
ncbi:hypothetical protein N7488_011993 [Penicillium malachiteum]|nr:hypothetical protein N7488_011993 [Penicillium malachiteum]